MLLATAVLGAIEGRLALDGIVYLFLFAGFGGTGALIADRKPGNPIGWLLLLFPVTTAFESLAESYTLLARSGPLPEMDLVAWLAVWPGQIAVTAMLVLVPLLFPNGQLPSPRWRWYGRTAVGAVAVLGVVEMFDAGTEVLVNPWAVPLVVRISEGAGFVFGVLGVVSVASLLVRYRGATASERQQIKWLFYAISLFVGAFLLNTLIFTRVPGSVTDLVFPILLLLLPVSIGVAILRHQLYDIDRIIKRTAVYAVVVAVLAGVYVAAVLGLQALLGASDPLAVAGSTLAAAALFNPVRRRVQGWVDRRFDRARYDAGRVVDEFTARLRHEVDLAGLTSDLTGVVTVTLRPVTVGLWVRAEQ
jgi:hypothetical protein